MRRAAILPLILTISILACRVNPGVPLPTPTVSVSATEADSNPAPIPRASPFGLLVSGRRPDVVSTLTDLGADWARVNLYLDGNDPDLRPFLDAGINLILTISNRDPSNADSAYGSLEEWPNAGFPYHSREAYQTRVRAALKPLLPYLGQGLQIWVQAENEVGDAALNPKSKYWRGDTDQYLAQLSALYEAVKSLDPSIPVVLSSFPSETLDKALDASDPLHVYATNHMQRLLLEGAYDAADLHFYGCVEDIPAKVGWVKAVMPAGKLWISTENGGPDPRCPSTPHTWDEDPAAYEQMQVEQVSARLTACRENGGAICLWFSLFDLKNEVEPFAHMGLLDPRVSPPQKKPAYEAFKKFVEENVP
jgi:hypothetical protein